MATLAAALTKALTSKTPEIVRRELGKGFIKATDINGIVYRSVSGKAVSPGSFVDSKTGKTFTPYSAELQTKEMLNAKRDMTGFSRTYNKGLADERMIVQFLKDKGFNIRVASKEENYSMDIDCWIGNIPVSIKAEHDGERYGDIYFETRNQLTATGEWVEDGWYHKGSAEKYLILQGNTLTLYDKATIKEHVEQNGWSHTRTLSWKRKAQQGGTYRTMDTECGFIKKNLLPYECQWSITEEV